MFHAKWNLKNGDPLNLVIAADARLCKPDYRNDQIWEITLGRRDPPASKLKPVLACGLPA